MSKGTKQKNEILNFFSSDKSIRDLELKKMKLYSKALKQFPRSPAQNKTMQEIDILTEKIKKMKAKKKLSGWRKGGTAMIEHSEKPYKKLKNVRVTRAGKKSVYKTGTFRNFTTLKKVAGIGEVIKVGDLVKVKKYGWIMRVVDIVENTDMPKNSEYNILYMLENDKVGYKFSGKAGNPGSYFLNDIQKIDEKNIAGTKKTIIETTDKSDIKKGLKNPKGMLILDKPEIRKAVADEVKDIIRKLQNKNITGTKRTKGSDYHKDTKSHNVNIRVISGLKLKYKIFQGYDWKNAKYIYHVIGINNDYVGEWHSTKKEAQKELRSLSKKAVNGIYKSNG